MGINKVVNWVCDQLYGGSLGLVLVICLITFLTSLFPITPGSSPLIVISSIEWIIAGIVFFILLEWMFIEECVTNPDGVFTKDTTLWDYAGVKALKLGMLLLLSPIIIIAGALTVGVIWLLYLSAILVGLHILAILHVLVYVVIIVGAIALFFGVNALVGMWAARKNLAKVDGVGSADPIPSSSTNGEVC